MTYNVFGGTLNLAQPTSTSVDPVRDNLGEPVPEETFTHSHSSWSSNIHICLLHLLRSMASSLFNPHALQSFSTIFKFSLVSILKIKKKTFRALVFSLLSLIHTCTHARTHMYTHTSVLQPSGLCPVPEPIWILLRQDTVSGMASARPYANLHLVTDK